MKIGILIPSTSKNRNWKCIKESYLYNCLLKSLLITMDKEHNYELYIVIDNDDPIYSLENEQKELLRFKQIITNLDIIFLNTDTIPKGWVTHMWNKAFKTAYDNNCDYFFQCGDDIIFQDKNWVNESIAKLKEHNDVGLTGPIDLDRWNCGVHTRPGSDRFIQTQSFVSRKHMELFGYYFPPDIKNWYCDDWMTKVYYPDYFYLIHNFIKNTGGEPRYEVIGSLDKHCPIRKKCFELIEEDKKKLNINMIQKVTTYI